MGNNLETSGNITPVDSIIELSKTILPDIDIVTGDEWKRLANCKDQTKLFYSTYKSDIEIAKRICADCVVRELCLETAITNGEAHGVWGGATESERN